MAIEGYVKFEYFSKGVPPYYNKTIFHELIDDEKITVETPNLEMSYHQYFGLFKKFLMSVGFDEKNVMQGACHLAFNESNREEIMREVAEEYDLIMSEQLPDIIADSKKRDEEWIEKTSDNWEQRYWALYRKMYKTEESKYTDEELDAMCDAAQGSKLNTKSLTDKVQEGYSYWNNLVPGSLEAREHGCTCPVLDNEEMPVDKKWVNSKCPIHGKKNKEE